MYEDQHAQARQGRPAQGPRCPGCGTVDPDPLARFCGVCGTAMGAAAPVGSPTGPTVQVPAYGYEPSARQAPFAPPMPAHAPSSAYPGAGPALQGSDFAIPSIDLAGAGQIGAAISAVFNLVPCLLFAWAVAGLVNGTRWMLDSWAAASIRVPIPLASVDVPVNYIDLFRLRPLYDFVAFWDDRLWLTFALAFLVPWVFSIVAGALYGGALAAIYNMVGRASGGMHVRLVPRPAAPAGQPGQSAGWSGGQMPGPPPGQPAPWPQPGWPAEPRR